VPVYDRSDANSLAVVDDWAGGVGWLAHPEEGGERVGHAFADGDECWVVDPLDAPGLDDVLAAVGNVAGVVVLSNYHARDASEIASRHGVTVHIPDWTAMDRVVERVDAPAERFSGGFAGFDVRRVDPAPGWTEAVAYRERDGTLYVPDLLSPLSKFAVSGERIGMFLGARLRPPRKAFADWIPERIVFGHGAGIETDASSALADCLANARRRFPRALLETGPAQAKAILGALGE
jgi:hypothetical protein